MKELVVISGKGGTGKTSLTASFALLADRPVVADCDVDAADLHLILTPRRPEAHEFRSGRQAVIRNEDCTGCGLCLELCRFEAVRRTSRKLDELQFAIDPAACEGCGVCVRFCPAKAIDFPEHVCGEWLTGETRCGPMVYARLDAGAENSGKLVSVVRREARRIAEADGRSLVIIDGAPGIGCPVIASVTGASQVLVVAEPTVAGEHDLMRILALTRHFGIPAAVCVNRWDLNPDMTDRIEDAARRAEARIASRVRYDPCVTRAQLQERAVVEMEAPAGDDIRMLWKCLGQD